MEGKAVMKVPGGKLLRAAVRYDGGDIESVRLSGDFFMYPEDGLERLEAALSGIGEEMLPKAIEEGLSGCRLFGIDAPSIEAVIREAMDGL